MEISGFMLSFIRILELVALAAVAVCPFWAMVAVKRQLKAVRHQRESSLADDWDYFQILAMFQFCPSWLLFAVVFTFLCPEQTVSSLFHCLREYLEAGAQMWPILKVYFMRRLCQTFLCFFLWSISSHFSWKKQHQPWLWQVALLGSFSTAMDAIDLFGTRTGPGSRLAIHRTLHESTSASFVNKVNLI